MTLDTYRTTYAWKSSLDLAPHLVRLAEQLPESETAGLASLLRTLSADVPGAIATDIVTGSRTAVAVMLRTVAALEVIERVYPALDTAAVRAATDELTARVAGDNFAEAVPAPAAPVDPDAEAPSEGEPAASEPAAATPEPAPAPATPPAPTAVPVAATDFTGTYAAPTPVSVPLTPAPDQPPAAAVDSAPVAEPAPAAAPLSIPVTEAPSVQPDSPQ